VLDVLFSLMVLSSTDLVRDDVPHKLAAGRLGQIVREDQR
jgi:hypothetical protein